MDTTTPELCFGQADAGFEQCAGAINQEPLFDLLGRQACASCVSCRLSELETETRHDVLTGIMNRRGLEDAYERLFEQGHPIGGIMIDLTSFKKINQKLGHPGGDAALQVTADFLTRSLRDTDAVITRTGGDEFVLLIDLCPRPDEDDGDELTLEERVQKVEERLTTAYVERDAVKKYNSLVAADDEEISLRIKSGVCDPATNERNLVSFLRRIDPKGTIAEAYGENPEAYRSIATPDEVLDGYIDAYVHSRQAK